MVGPPLTPWAWGYWPYYNPYYSGPIVVEGTTIDYSQPIVLAPTPNETATKDQAMEMLSTARELFRQGDYAQAMTQCDKAIAKQPNDPVLHEFRGLVQFALRQYKEAAGTVYAVLSVGPGWDWTTLHGFYPHVDVYTEQLRALEDFVRTNPDQPEARFLLAYHYMTCGHNDAAAEQFRAIVKLNSSDRLSAQLLASLTKTDPPTPAAAPATSDPSLPVNAQTLAGDWKATREDEATISLSLNADGAYRWKFVQNGKTQEFSGAYTVADSLLILKENNSPVMVGEVRLLGPNQFNFKLPGSVANDPGLTFEK